MSLRKNAREMRQRTEITATINKIQQVGLIEVITSKLLLEVMLDIRDLLNEKNLSKDEASQIEEWKKNVTSLWQMQCLQQRDLVKGVDVQYGYNSYQQHTHKAQCWVPLKGGEWRSLGMLRPCVQWSCCQQLIVNPLYSPRIVLGIRLEECEMKTLKWIAIFIWRE